MTERTTEPCTRPHLTLETVDQLYKLARRVEELSADLQRADALLSVLTAQLHVIARSWELPL